MLRRAFSEIQYTDIVLKLNRIMRSRSNRCLEPEARLAYFVAQAYRPNNFVVV